VNFHELPAKTPRISLVKSQLGTVGGLEIFRLDQIAWASRDHLAGVKSYRWLSLNLGYSGVGFTLVGKISLCGHCQNKHMTSRKVSRCWPHAWPTFQDTHGKKEHLKKKNVYYSSIYESPPSEWNIKA
jgi:hypothetical protein